jgi:L-2-hydroxyglutarate oxidase LhgO
MRVVVIGGGLVGLAVTREILARLPSAGVTLLEKEAGSAATRARTTAACCMPGCITSQAR